MSVRGWMSEGVFCSNFVAGHGYVFALGDCAGEAPGGKKAPAGFGVGLSLSSAKLLPRKQAATVQLVLQPNAVLPMSPFCRVLPCSIGT